MLPSTLPPKYITENGVMKINPAYTAAKSKQGEQSTLTDPSKALAIISTHDEMAAAQEVRAKDKMDSKPIQTSVSCSASMEILQDKEFLDKFKAPKPLDGGDLLDKLYTVFARYEVPMGLVNKLLKLGEYKLNFIIDDSGSMNDNSDVTFAQATSHTQKYRGTKPLEAKLTRWQEAEDRLHILIELIGFIPTNGIVINYLNETDHYGSPKKPMQLVQTGKAPEDFIADAHKQISQFFTSVTPTQGTPIHTTLSKALAETKSATMHYLFTDGEPSDKSCEEVAKLIEFRKNPELNPITLISCSDQDTEWMKEVEERAKFVAELDDFNSERKEVARDQGPVFPYSKGMWLMCNLVAAVCPTDLDAMDESIPLTKGTMDNLLGRKLNSMEYREYFTNNPNSKKFASLYSQFEREDLEAHQIIAPIKAAIDEANKIENKIERDKRIEAIVVAYAPSVSKSSASGMGLPPSYAESQAGLFRPMTAIPQASGMMGEYKVPAFRS